MSDLTSSKSGWSRPENYTQWFPVLAVGGAIFYFLDKILPFVISVLENTLYTAVLGLGVAAFIALLMSKDLHIVGYSLYRSGIKWLTNLVVRIDPISILEDGIRRVGNRLREMRLSEGELISAIRALKDLITSNTKEYGEEMKVMSAAKKQVASGNKAMKGRMVLSARQAGRLEESNMTYQGLLNKMEGWLAVAIRFREASELVEEDMKNTVKNEKIKRKAIRAAYKSLMNAKKVMQGDAQRELYDMAIETLADDYFSKIGEMEQFIDESKGFLQGMDLQNGIYEEEALKKLEDWENKTDGILSVGKTRIKVDDESEEGLIGRSDELDAQGSLKRQSYPLFEIKK